jgi:hypothetical protein
MRPYANVRFERAFGGWLRRSHKRLNAAFVLRRRRRPRDFVLDDEIDSHCLSGALWFSRTFDIAGELIECNFWPGTRRWRRDALSVSRPATPALPVPAFHAELPVGVNSFPAHRRRS